MRMRHVTRIDFSVLNQTQRAPAVVQVASSGIATGWSAERGRVRAAPSAYTASLDQTPYLNPLPFSKGRGEAKQNADALS
jgi:hypothetical protein